MNVDAEKTIFIIDGSSFLYRAYYGLRPLHTADGQSVQAVYGFCRMIKKIIDTFHPRYMALVWDSKGKTERHALYQEYKATRQAPPSDIFDQKEYIVEFADLIGLKQLARPGVEADDLMYSLAREWTKAGDMAVLATLDKDMSQALDAHTVLFDPFKYEFITQSIFESSKGILVSRLPFYFALLGDTSDNIPGVAGIGPKGALELVTNFDSLEDLYARIDEVRRPAVKKLLIEQKQHAFLSRDLFLLRYHSTQVTKLDCSFDLHAWDKARPLFERLQFKSFLNALTGAAAQQLHTVEDKIAFWKQCAFHTVTTHEQLVALADLLRERKLFAFDTETTGLRSLEVALLGMSFCVDGNEAYYVPCGAPSLSVSVVLSVLGPILQDPACKKYMHHAKYDMLVLSNYGIEVQGLALDTMVGAHLILQDWQRPSLKDLSDFYFKEQMLTYAEVVKQFKYTNFSQVPLELATLYAAADARQTFKLAGVIQQALDTHVELGHLYATLEHPLIHLLYTMEKTGIICDKAVLSVLDAAVSKALTRIELDIHTFLPEDRPINLNSSKQIERLLFEELQLPPQKKSAKGDRFSTDQEVLTALADMHPVPALLIKYRELTKLKNTYIEALPEYINPKTGRIHTTFSQTSVATGRLASSDPNLQNIPADSSDYGLHIRAAFKAQPGHTFISADYSQIELRVLAHLSGDATLTNAFLLNTDIHAQTAAHLFDVALDKVEHQQRQLGKRINFSILYGLTPYGLSKDLGISFKDAKRYIEKYFAQYQGVSAWMEQVIAFAKEHGYVQTVWGRRRYIPAIYEKNKSLYEEACRVAINTVAQGTAAEIMKKGMLNVDSAFKHAGIEAQMLLQIHDELVISVNTQQRAQAELLIRQILESVVDWPVPLSVTTRSGADWREISK